MSGLVVVRPGLLTTVQDLGRWGSQVIGVPVAGPMDSYSHRLANLLVGNASEAATLEVTLIGPELEFQRDAVVAVAGADFELLLDDQPVATHASLAVPTGGRLRFGRRRSGARAYVAIDGGVAVPPVLGSRATHLVSALGGVEGRALRAGDAIPLGPRQAAPEPKRRAPGLALAVPRLRLRVLLGPQDDWFTPAAREIFLREPFRVSPTSNRMGYRLEGKALQRARDAEPISEPVTMGAIQVPPAGDPILLMADRQTAGGYPKIATVVAADLPLAGQLGPGDLVEFRPCTRTEAMAAHIARERQLLHLAGRWATS